MRPSVQPLKAHPESAFRGDVHDDPIAVEIAVMQRADGSRPVFSVSHRHETEVSRGAGVSIGDDDGLRNDTERLEVSTQTSAGRGVAKATYEQLRRNRCGATRHAGTAFERPHDFFDRAQVAVDLVCRDELWPAARCVP